MISRRKRFWTLRPAHLYLPTICLILAACSGLSPTASPTPSPSLLPPTETPTVLWFPPTNTPTSLPSPTVFPTVNARPGLGSLLFFDSFDQPELWNTATSASASAAVIRNRLVLSISGPGPLFIASLRAEPTLGDFYAEAMANVSLCHLRDQFGMVFRAASGADYYRFTVNCAGQVRLERSRAGSVVPLLQWLDSGDTPPGAPAEVKLGVWAVGSEFRFFLNDHYQFTFHDPILRNGALGFFAYASGETPVTVSFSDLSVYSVFYLSPTPSLTSSRTPTPSRTPKP